MSSTVISLIVLALLAVGILLSIKQKNVTETGNVLGIEWYNETDTEFVITTVEELYELADLSDFYNFKGQTVKLGADIVVNEGNADDWKENAPARKWNPIAEFAGTFDGQGHTISGIYAVSLNAPMGMFIKSDKSCTVKDFKLTNSYFDAYGNSGVGTIVSNGGGNFSNIYSDANIFCNGYRAGGFAGTITKQAVFENCWYDGDIVTIGRESGGLIGKIIESRVTIKNCLFSGTIDNTYTFQESRTGGNRIGGVCGLIDKTSSLIMSQSLVTGKVTTDVNYQTGAFLGQAFTGAQISTTDVYVADNVFGRVIGKAGRGGTMSGYPIIIRKEELIGMQAYKRTLLDFSKVWEIEDESTPVLKAFAENTHSYEGIEKDYDISWYQNGVFSYAIQNEKQLYGLALLSYSTDFAERSVRLEADITLNTGKATDWAEKAPENLWLPIYQFSGLFDGKNHTISGAYRKWAMEDYPLAIFGSVGAMGTIQNLNVKNSYFESTATGTDTNLAGVAGTVHGKLKNIYCNAIIKADNQGSGGIAGAAGGASEKLISNCWFDGEVVLGENGRYGGGILGFINNGTMVMEHCLFSGSLTTNHKTVGTNTGGILGTINGGTGVEITDCFNSGIITANGATNNLGSVIGYLQKDRNLTIADTYATSESFTKAIGLANGNVKGTVLVQPEDNLIGNGGYSNTTLDFDKYWSIVKTGTPILKQYATTSPSVSGLVRNIDISWYDSTAREYVIKNAKQLYTLSIVGQTENFSGKAIKLDADITLNSGNAANWATNAPALHWMPIKQMRGAFDGQGHTISGLYSKYDTEKHVGFIGLAFGDIKNLKITNSYFCTTESKSGDTAIGSVVAVTRGSVTNVYSDAIIDSDAKNWTGGLVGVMNADTDKVISNCWFDGSITMGANARYGGGILGRSSGGTVLIEHCLNSGSITTNNTVGPNTGGILGGITGGKQTTISDCLGVGKVVGNKAKNNLGSIVGMIDANQKLAIMNTYATLEAHEKGIGINYKGTQKGAVIQKVAEDILGYEGYQWTTLDFDKYWTVSRNPDGTPVLQTFATRVESLAGVERLIDTSWYKESAKEFSIRNEKQLHGLSILSAIDNFKGKTVKLTAKIEVKNKWTPIANFAGTFLGQGHTISGIHCVTTNDDVGLFAKVTGATISDLKLVDCSFESAGSNVGSIAGYGYGIFTKIYSNSTVITDGGSNIGGLLGQARDGKSTFSECWFKGTVEVKQFAEDKYGYDAGGLVGKQMRCDLTFEHCLNEGTVTSAGKRVGGFVARFEAENAEKRITITVKDSLNLGGMTGINQLGTIYGSAGSWTTVDFENVYGINVGYVPEGMSTVTPQQVTDKEAYLMTTLDFDTYWAARIGDTCAPKHFVPASEQVDLSKVIKPDTSWYKESENVFTITTKEQLYGFAKLSSSESFYGKTIKLGNDITVNEGDPAVDKDNWANKAPNLVWNPISSASGNAFQGTFDGQGKTIYGIYATGTSGIGLFGYVHPYGTIQNLQLKKSYFAADSTVGSIAGAMRGQLLNTYSNAIVVGKVEKIGGLIGVIDDANYNLTPTKTISGCWFDGQVNVIADGGWRTGGIIGGVFANSSRNVIMHHCYNSGTISTGEHTVQHNGRIGGFIGDISSGMLWMEDCFNSGTITCVGTAKGSIIGYTGVNVKAVNVYATTESCKSGDAHIAVGTNANKVNGTINHFAKLTLHDSLGYVKLNLNFDNTGTEAKYDGYWTARKGNVPALRAFVKTEDRFVNLDGVSRDVVASTVDIGWYDMANSESTIFTKEQLWGFAELSKVYTFEGKTIKLGADITVNNGLASDWNAGNNRPTKSWTPISPNTTYCFRGTFNGMGHKIIGLYCNDTTSAYVGLFGYVHPDGVLTNFGLVNSYVEGGNASGFTGSIAGECNGSITHVYSNAYVRNANASGGNVGGIVGGISTNHYNVSLVKTIANCWFDGVVDIAGLHAGGMLGRIQGETNNTLHDGKHWILQVNITNCLNTGSVTARISHGRAAGMVGCAQRNVKVVVSSSFNKGTITAAKNAYSMVAYYATNAEIVVQETTYAVTKATTTGDGYEAKNMYAQEQFYSANKDNIALEKSVWTFFADKTPEITSLRKYVQ